MVGLLIANDSICMYARLSCITNRWGLFLRVGHRHLGTWLLQKIEKAYIFWFADCVALRCEACWWFRLFRLIAWF